MPVDSSSVQIVINVVDGNSGEVVNKVTKSIESIGGAGASTGDKVAAGMDKIKGHSLSALDNVRLLRDDIGVRIPRSMEKAIASSKLLMAGISAIGTGLLAIGAIDIGIRIGKGLYDAYEKWISLSAAAKEYQDQVDKAKDEDFINVRDIETARDRIKEATEAAKGFQDAAKQMRSGFWADVAQGFGGGGGLSGAAQAAAMDLYGARQMANQGFKRQGQVDALKPEEVSLRHQALLDEIELQHSEDGRLRGAQKFTAELEKQKAINAENRRFEVEHAKLKGNDVPEQAGRQHQEYLDQIATQKADAEAFNLRRQQAIELQHMEEAAREAGLRGNALFAAQEAAAIDELKNKDMDSVAARNAVHEKFHNEEMKRLQDQENEIRKMRDQTAAAGLTGVARIQQEGRNKINDILNDPNSTLNPGQRLAMIKEITAQTQQAVAQEQETFGEHVTSIVEQSASRAIQGFARIHAEAQHEIEQLRRESDEKGGRPEDLSRGVAAIKKAEGNQVVELQRKNAEETSQIEAEARAKFLSAERNQTAAIVTEYEERLRKYQEQLDQQEISQQDFDRRIVAAAELRDAQLADSARQAREKMAGEFTRFFSNPTQALKELGNRAAGETAAALVQRLQGHVFGGSTGEHLGLPGGIFGQIAGLPRINAQPNGSRAASGTLAINAAQIHVGTASIAFGGGFAGGSTSTGGVQFSPALFTGSSSGIAGASMPSFSSAGSTFAGSAGGGINAALSNVGQGVGLFKQAKTLFGGGTLAGGDSADVKNLDLSGSFDKNGNFQLGKSNSTLFNGGGMGAAVGAAGGAMGLFSAYQGNGGIGGALGGAMSGMQLGMALGGPIGAAIGAAGGAIFGALGFGGREKARVYDLKTVQPRITADIQAYQQGGMDYLTAYSDLMSLDAEARKTLRQMGGFGDRYYWGTVNGEIRQAEAKLSSEERAGRSRFHATAAQFAVGTDSVPRDGYAFIHARERIMPSDQNERITRAIESSAESSRMVADTDSAWGGDLHIHALDAKSSIQWLMANKHNVRAAINASYAENSGGADA